MAIKKAFQPLVELLQENQDKKVKNIIDDVLALCETKSRAGGATTVHRDDEGNVVAIFDYYFKLWMPLSHIEFGAKASSGTGYNSMCKEGVSNWTRQRSAAKKAESALLDQAISGDVQPDELKELKAEIEAARDEVVAHSTGIGFETIEALEAADTADLDRMVEEAIAAAKETEAEEVEDQAQAA